MNNHALADPAYTEVDGTPLREGLVQIVCSCGFRVTTSRDKATAIAHGHIERARRRREGYPPQTGTITAGKCE